MSIPMTCGERLRTYIDTYEEFIFFFKKLNILQITYDIGTFVEHGQYGRHFDTGCIRTGSGV